MYDDLTARMAHVLRPAELERIERDPGFADAARQAAVLATVAPDADPVLFGLFRDTGRFVSAMLALYLDASGKLTHATLSRLVNDLGRAGFGRVSAMLLFMRSIGYIAPAPPAADQREKRFVPTARMSDAVLRRFRREFALAAPFHPACARAGAMLDTPEGFAAFCVAAGEVTLGAFRQPVEEPSLNVFSGRVGGMTMLAHMLLSVEGAAAFPRAGRVTVSLSALSRRCRVTRGQVGHVLKAAEAAGFMVRDDREWLLSEALTAQVRLFTAVRVLLLAQIADRMAPT